MLNLPQLIDPLIALARKASEVILDIYQHSQQYQIQTKEDQSPVTQADLQANEVLRKGLAQLTPQLPYLSEEATAPSWQERQSWSRYWLVDPLDGTREFIKHSGEFTINIALIDQQQPVLGMLFVPVTGECYYACRGHGSFKMAASQLKQAIRVRPWSVNQTLLLVSHGAKEEIIQENFAGLGEFQMTRMSSALKFAKVAEGLADMAPRLGNTSEWDTAAGQCILEEAGGGLFDLQGEALRYNSKESLLNPHFIALGDLCLYKKINWKALP